MFWVEGLRFGAFFTFLGVPEVHLNPTCQVPRKSEPSRHSCIERVTSHMDEPCHIRMSHVTCGWVMSPMDESRHKYMSHVTYGWAMLHMDESCHIRISHDTHGWVMSHMDELYRIWIEGSEANQLLAHFVTNTWNIVHETEPFRLQNDFSHPLDKNHNFCQWQYLKKREISAVWYEVGIGAYTPLWSKV